jgi:hypothetical protein
MRSYPPPEPLLPLLLLLDEELLRPPLEDVELLLLPDEDEPLLLAAPEDEELPPLEDELLLLELELELEFELELAVALLPLPLPPPPQAATVRQEMTISRLSSSVEWRMGSVLIRSAMRWSDGYSLNRVCGEMSRSRDGIFRTPVTLSVQLKGLTGSVRTMLTAATWRDSRDGRADSWPGLPAAEPERYRPRARTCSSRLAYNRRLDTRE